MPRRRSSRRREPSRAWSFLPGIALIAVCIAAVGAFAAFKFSQPERPELEATTLCPVDGPRSLTVVLLDATDPLPGITQRELQTYLTDLAETLPEYGLLELRLLAPEVPGGRVAFSKCNPGDGSNLSEWSANPTVARKRWLDEFRTPLDRALTESLGPAAADTSPILSTLQAIAVERFLGRNAERIPKRLVVVSDMIENDYDYSHYNSDLLYETFRSLPAYKRLRTDLKGAEVFILYVQRTKPAIDSGKHIRFWLDWISDNNGRAGKPAKLQGAE